MRWERSTSNLLGFKTKMLKRLWKCWDNSVLPLLPVQRGSTKTPWANPWNSGHSLNLTHHLILSCFMLFFFLFKSLVWIRFGCSWVQGLGFRTGIHVWELRRGWRSRRGNSPGIPYPWNPSLCALSWNTWIFSNTLMLLKHFRLFRIRIMESLRMEKTPKVGESNLSLPVLGIPGAELELPFLSWEVEVMLGIKSWLWCYLLITSLFILTSEL